MNQPKTYPSEQVMLVAQTFATLMMEALTSEEMAEVRKRNLVHGPSGPCASHDFCDANMVMEEAMSSCNLAGQFTPPVLEDPKFVAFWNEAWSLAKANQFRITYLMCDELEAYCAAQGLAPASVDEMIDALLDLPPTIRRAEQIGWLTDFYDRWEAAEALEDK